LYIFPLISTKDIFSINRLTMMGMILKIIWYRKLYDTENYMILKIIWYWKLWYWKLYDTENYHDTENYMIQKIIWYWKLYDTEIYQSSSYQTWCDTSDDVCPLNINYHSSCYQT
jgi:hypothetical protein